VSGSVSAPHPAAVGESIGASHPHSGVTAHGAQSGVTVREPFARVSGSRARGAVTEE
jgi:hypothetical protein